MRTILVTSLLVACLAVGTPAVASARQLTVDIDDFMTGLACTESSGRFEALNRFSGAMGKYQIMPKNWRAWALRYMGNPWAQTSPRNQEFVAAGANLGPVQEARRLAAGGPLVAHRQRPRQ